MTELSRKQLLLLAAAFVAGSLLIYTGVGQHELLNWDDRSYTVNNPWVTNPSAANLVSLFTESRVANWHPLTWLSFIPEYAVCGDNAVCYKTTNALLHGLVSFLAALLCAVIIKLASPECQKQWVRIAGSFCLPYPLLAGLIAGLLFLVHPQHVESVTWVAQRKDLLCALFYFLGLLVYCHASRSNYAGTYGLCFICFALAAMSKSMAVSMPVILVLLDLLVIHPSLVQQRAYIQLARVLLLEKLPFYVLLLLIIWVTMSSQSVSGYDPLSLEQHLALVFSGLQHYLLAFVLPLNLSPFYPAAIAQLDATTVLPGLMLLLCAIVCFWQALMKQKLVLLALLLSFMLVTLLPVIGVVRVGEQAFADRYSYIPLLGLYAAVAWLICAGLDKVKSTLVVLLPLSVLIVSLATLSATYKHVWANDVAFWTTVVSRYPESAAMPLDNLANAWAVAGDYEQAAANYQRSLEIDPGQDMSYINLAIVQQFSGDADAAMETLLAGVRENANSPALLSRAGRALLERGELGRAEQLLARGIALRPDLPDLHLSLGLLRKVQGNLSEAADFFQRIPPNMPQFYEANLQLLDLMISLDPQAAQQKLTELLQFFGETEELLDMQERLAAR